MFDSIHHLTGVTATMQGPGGIDGALRDTQTLYHRKLNYKIYNFKTV